MKIEHNRSKKWKDSFKWHKWFAWHPVDDNNTTVWWEEIWRRRETSWYEDFWTYNFGDKKPEDTDD